MSGVSNLRTFRDGAVVFKAIVRERWMDRRPRVGGRSQRARPLANPPWMTAAPDIDLVQLESEHGA
jgi:hypothetical protein